MHSEALAGPASAVPEFPSGIGERVQIPLHGIDLAADLVVPASARGVVVFVLAAGCIRETERAPLIAREIAASGIATLTLPLLTPAEMQKDHEAGCWSFDLDLLSHRWLRVTSWLMQQPRTRALSVGYMGSSTFAAAALIAAAQLGQLVRAVVARSGRPDLARSWLRRVTAPTLLIVGGADEHLGELNERALGRLACPKQLLRVAGATQLFEQPGALERVGALAAGWFRKHLGGIQPDAGVTAARRADGATSAGPNPFR